VEDRRVPELLRQASVILAREVGKIPRTILDEAIPNLAGRSGLLGGEAPSSAYASGIGCPVTGAAIPSEIPGAGDLRRQAHEFVGSLFSLWNPQGTGPGLSTPALPNAGYQNVAADRMGKSCPVTKASVPTFAVQRDELRRRSHELIETLLITFNEATGEKGLPTENQVPLVSCAAPVQPGSAGRVTLSVANEEATPTEVTLYSTNFVADHGYEIPSLRVTILPRMISIPARGKVDFEISIAVPQQTPRGYYSGLIQAMGSKYFKAVLSMEVL
jgi:hypothetical protein